MKLENYLSKHGLTVKATVEGYASTGEWITCCKNDSCCGDEMENDACAHDRFEIHGNADNTHIVAVNKSKDLFRICHCEMLCLCSEWAPVDQEYETAALVKSSADCGCNGKC